MSYSLLEFTGDGETVTFPIAFTLGYLSQDDVFCRVNNEVDVNGDPVYRSITWLPGNEGLVTIGGDVPEVGVPIVFSRVVDKDKLLYDFQKNDPIDERSLDESHLQLMMAMHEVLDGIGLTAVGVDIDMQGHKLINAYVDLDDPDSIATVGALADALAGKQDAVITTRGDLIVGGVGGVPERLAAGTVGQYATWDESQNVVVRDLPPRDDLYNWNMVQFDATGDWTVPAGVESVIVEVLGGGGGGYQGVHAPGAGGAAGVFVRARVAVTSGAVVPVTVGGGGAGGKATTTAVGIGGPGGASSFGSYVTADGGTIKQGNYSLSAGADLLIVLSDRSSNIVVSNGKPGLGSPLSRSSSGVGAAPGGGGAGGHYDAGRKAYAGAHGCVRIWYK